jgi:hypothetical protein
MSSAARQGVRIVSPASAATRRVFPDARILGLTRDRTPGRSEPDDPDLPRDNLFTDWRGKKPKKSRK